MNKKSIDKHIFENTVYALGRGELGADRETVDRILGISADNKEIAPVAERGSACVNCSEMPGQADAPLVLNLGVPMRNGGGEENLWSGKYLRAELMSVPRGGSAQPSAGLGTDRYFRIERGIGALRLTPCGGSEERTRRLGAGDAVLVPAETACTVENLGGCPLRLSVIYAPTA